MDKEHARFILRSYRPDGADAQDPDFRAALSLATQDRELGEWLADERVEDAAFANALKGTPVPETLRATLLTDASGPDSTPTQVDSDLDSTFVSALASIEPPALLRDQIVAAMEVEKSVVRPASSSWGWRKLSSAGAAAAAVVLGLLLTFGTGGKAIASGHIQDVHETAIQMLSAPLFSLDLKNPQHAAIFQWLESEQLPTPQELPEGLRGLEGVGCKSLEIGDQKTPGSLICFRKDSDTVIHLITMDRQAISAALPALSELDLDGCNTCSQKGWAATQWADEKKAYFLLSQMENSRLPQLF